MKKILYLLIGALLFIPNIASAAVNDQTEVGTYATRAECDARLALNDEAGNSQATSDWYLTCIKINCVSSRAFHEDLAPILTKVTCVNGNKNPFVAVRQSGITVGGALSLGAVCSTDDQSPEYLVETYATVKYQYNCMQTDQGTTYNPAPVGPGTTLPGNTTGTDEVKNAQTGINTYYLALTSIALILSGGVYIINKKNLFKKI